MPDLTISIVVHRQREDLERLLPSLLRAAGKVSAEILLVDNRSDDGTRELLARNDSVNVLPNAEKAGYGRNHNLNLLRARGEFFVVMNADMILTDEELFARMLDWMRRHPDVGVAGPRLLNEDGSRQDSAKQLPSLFDLFLRRFSSPLLRRRFQQRLDRYEMHELRGDAITDVPFLSGAFLFSRTDLLRRLGGFDERYFLYFEDVDLCRRVAETHRVVYCPIASAEHVARRSAHKRWRYTLYFMTSVVRYYLRWGLRVR